MEQMEKMVYSISEVAKLLGISKSFAYEMAKCKAIPVVELGTRKVVPKKKFEEWLEGREGSQ